LQTHTFSHTAKSEKKKKKKREEGAEDAEDGGQASAAKKKKKKQKTEQAGDTPVPSTAAVAEPEAAPENPNSLDNFGLAEPIKAILRADGIQELFAIQALTLPPGIEGKVLRYYISHTITFTHK
jgi:ATP-dependent RNA helicase DDX21